MNMANNMWNILCRFQRSARTNHSAECTICQQQHIHFLKQHVKRNEPLLMVLPAFPAKSANRNKTISALPDRGEIMGLQNLNTLCRDLTKEYPPGVQLLICSDGRVFNDLVHVTDAEVDAYQHGIMKIIRNQQLEYVQLLSLDDFYPSTTGYEELRGKLITEFAEDKLIFRANVLGNPFQQYQFNGMHRFIVEDQRTMYPHLSTNQLRKKIKLITYEVMRRSHAWSNLLARHFPHALRLSIHPQPCGSQKFGIQFLPAGDRWATPWHNVLLKRGDKWQLLKRAEAERLGATLYDDHYVLEHSA